MTASERHASMSLAGVFALRMFGLFIVLPVFALEAQKLPGGDDAALVGLAMGIYGLTQGLLQIPFGMASDYWGRKRVIIAGLFVFGAGSFLAAAATSLEWLIAGRSLQGAGAISAAVTALLADLTRDEVRTKAMAAVGASIGLMFALSLVAAPWLAAHIGLQGLFALTGVLTFGAAGVVHWVTPAEPALPVGQTPGGAPLAPFKQALLDVGLLRLDFGTFVLHAVQLAMWVAVPAMLVTAGLPKASHWQIYLPAVLLSFVAMGALFPLERAGYLRAAFLAAIALIALTQLGLWWALNSGGGVWTLGMWLFVFFCGFNVLEASQPSLASRLAPPQARGAALGVYNTVQSLGFFVGGALGGWLVQHHGFRTLFMACAAVMGLWLSVAWGMKAPDRVVRAAGQTKTASHASA